MTDRESAEECIKENMILRRIASHCVEQTDGLFLSLPEDGLEFQAKFVEACRAAGIRADVIDPKEALRLEPSANPAMVGAVRVPDGAVDPFRLTAANVIDAKAHGAEVLTYHEVLDFLREQNRITGVKVLDRKTGQTAEYRAQVVVNAGGIWGHDIARKAGVTVNMLPGQGLAADLRPQGEQHRAEPLPQAGRCRHPGAGRYDLADRAPRRVRCPSTRWTTCT